MADKELVEKSRYEHHMQSETQNEKLFVDESLEEININNNTSAKIKNPLAGIRRDVLLRDVEEFAQEYSLTEIVPLLKKGALVAQNPGEFENVEGIEESEKEALRNEVVHKWRQPRALYFTVILCSVGAAVQGVSGVVNASMRCCIADLILSGIKLDPMGPTCHSQINSASPTPIPATHTTRETCGSLALSTPPRTLRPPS